MRRFLCVLLAACPGSPKGSIPAAPTASVELADDWYAKGDAACPSLDIQIPGAPPGAGPSPGHLVRSVGDLHCEAAGRAHGPAERIAADGKPAELGEYHAGRREGVWRTFHPGGQLASTGAYRNGASVGTWSTFYPDGRPRDRGELFGDRRVGLWEYWRADGLHTFEDYDQNGVREMSGRYVGDTPREMLDVCAIGLAYPACRVIPIIDVGARADPTESTPAHGGKGSLTLDLGVLVNVTEHHAVGIDGGWQFDATYPSTELEGRYRYWLLEWLAVEAGAGKIYGRDGHPGGTIAHVAIVGADILSLTTTLEHRDDGSTSVLFGVRAGLPTVLGALLVASKK